MIKYIGKRLLYMVFVFIVMSILLFFLYNLIPGDPARAEVEGLKATLTVEEYQFRYEQARERLGLNDPLIVRYKKWLVNMLQGDFGQSSVYKRPVTEVVKTPMKTTVSINIFAIILGFAITIPLGVYCAVNKNSFSDKLIQVITIVGYSLPSFIICLLFIFLFAVKLQLFPISGMNTPNFTGTPWEVFKDQMWHMALPLAVMTVTSVAGLTKYVRAAMADSLSMDYIRTARAKGLKERVVIWSHAWRNALLPVVTLLVSWIISIFSGSLVVESIFNIKGMGKFYMDSLLGQDYNVALAIQMFYIVMALVGNLATDLSYTLVDPRVRVNK